jgi:hypothetical protein
LQNIQKVCSVCEEVIEGSYYTLNGEVFCEKDYKVSVLKNTPLHQRESRRSIGQVVSALQMFPVNQFYIFIEDNILSFGIQSSISNYSKNIGSHSA